VQDAGHLRRDLDENIIRMAKGRPYAVAREERSLLSDAERAARNVAHRREPALSNALTDMPPEMPTPRPT
jgi:hypothetical protein